MSQDPTPNDGRVFQDLETIRLTKDGVFLSNGEEVTHERTVEAYHRFLDRDDEGYFIRIGRDFKRIEVEDTARFVHAIHWIGGDAEERVELQLADGSRETLAPETLAYRPDRLVCRVRDGREEAKFLRQPYLELFMRRLEDGTKGGWSLRIAGRTYTL
jgi:hypothetical protein